MLPIQSIWERFFMTDNNTKNWKKVREETERLIDEQEQKTEAPVSEEMDEWQASPESDVADDSSYKDLRYKDLEEKLALSEQKADENLEQARRALAEMENIKRRADRDITSAHRYGQEKMANSLLPVIDSLEQALQLVDKEQSASMTEGLELTLKLFLDALKKNNIEQVDPMGAPFDPNEHEAMSIVEAPGMPANSIVTVFQKGYKLYDRMIRPARVIVAKS